MWSYVLRTEHIGPRCRSPDRQPTTTTGHHTTCCNFVVLRSWWWTKFCPKYVELILKFNKYCYLLHLVGFDFITLPTLKMHGQTQIKWNIPFKTILKNFCGWKIRLLFSIAPDERQDIFKRTIFFALKLIALILIAIFPQKNLKKKEI
jgi:hypothetical protein